MAGPEAARETEDPRAALAASDVATRAAGARDLAAVGVWDDVEGLVAIAMSDKSPSLRLCAAAAAADILARHRGAPGHEAVLSRERADQVLRWVGAVDPASNPSALMILSSVVTDRVLDRFGRLLRDPRTDVRKGAVAAIERMVLSGTMVEDTRVIGFVERWFQSRKMTPDVVYELIQLVGRAGLGTLAPLLADAAGARRPHAAAVEAAREQLRLRGNAESWSGLWSSTGFDVMELEVGERSASWLLLGAGAYRSSVGERGSLVIQDGVSTLGGVRCRMVWARKMGAEEYCRAIQIGGQTFWEVTIAELPAAIEARLVEFEHADADLVHPLVERLEADATGPSLRGAALLAWRAGLLQRSLDGFGQLLEAKRPKNDLYYYRGRVHLDRGDLDSARGDLERFLAGAGQKRSPLREEAAALVEALR